MQNMTFLRHILYRQCLVILILSILQYFLPQTTTVLTLPLLFGPYLHYYYYLIWPGHHHKSCQVLINKILNYQISCILCVSFTKKNYFVIKFFLFYFSFYSCFHLFIKKFISSNFFVCSKCGLLIISKNTKIKFDKFTCRSN